MMIGEAQRAAQSSAAGFRVQRAMDIPTKAKLDVIASLKWYQASLSMALLSKPFPTAETYRESTTLTATTAKSTRSVYGSGNGCGFSILLTLATPIKTAPTISARL